MCWRRGSIIGKFLVALSLLPGAGCARRATPLQKTQPPTGQPSSRAVAPLFEPWRAGQLLDAPSRDRWQQPARLVRALHLRRGETVADIGAGSGYLLPHLSRAVGPQGTVYAEEIQNEFLPALRRHAGTLKNVRVVLGTAGDPRLPRGRIGCFVLLTTYHEVQKPVEFLRALRRLARPDAKLAIVDFDHGRRGDPPAPIGHEIAAATVIEEAREAGWRLHEKHEFLSSQFFLVFRL